MSEPKTIRVLGAGGDYEDHPNPNYKPESSLAPVSGSVTVVALTGDETEEQCKDIAWQMFCNAHPVEAYAHNPDGFWNYFHSRAPNVTREQMVALLKESEEPESPNDQAEAPTEKP